MYIHFIRRRWLSFVSIQCLFSQLCHLDTYTRLPRLLYLTTISHCKGYRCSVCCYVIHSLNLKHFAQANHLVDYYQLIDIDILLFKCILKSVHHYSVSLDFINIIFSLGLFSFMVSLSLTSSLSLSLCHLVRTFIYWARLDWVCLTKMRYNINQQSTDTLTGRMKTLFVCRYLSTMFFFWIMIASFMYVSKYSRWKRLKRNNSKQSTNSKSIDAIVFGVFNNKTNQRQKKIWRTVGKKTIQQSETYLNNIDQETRSNKRKKKQKNNNNWNCLNAKNEIKSNFTKD